MTDEARATNDQITEEAYNRQIAAAARKAHASWGITGYKEMEISTGLVFSCQLTVNGVVVADIEQGGNGGMDQIYWTPTALTDGTAQRFEAEMRALFPQTERADDEMIEALLSRQGL